MPGCTPTEAGPSFVSMTLNTRDEGTRVTAASLATMFLAAQSAGECVEPPSVTHDGFRGRDAYRVGAEIARLRRGDGWRREGWKVGFTNREIWPRWGLDRPIVAPVYRETTFRARGPHLTVPMGTRAAPRLEVEVVFGVEGGVSGSRPRWVALGAELVDCHYAGWRMHPADAVADFGLHAGLIVGPPVPLGKDRGGLPDPRRALPEMAVSLAGDGTQLAEGHGSAVLGSPFAVLAELHRSLKPAMAIYSAPRGDSPAGAAGYLVSTGTLTPLVEAHIGIRYEIGSDLLPGLSFQLV